MESRFPQFAGHSSLPSTQRQGVSASSFLKNLEKEDDNSERMRMDESIVGLEEESHLTKLLQGKLQELRHQISEHVLLQSKTTDDLDFSQVPSSANIILFGPAGSGKSSVIRTVYSALSGVFKLPRDLEEKLLIKKLNANEGTTRFTKVEIQRPQKNVLKAGGVSYEYKTSGINMYDTRGQILLDEQEMEALKIMMEVKTTDPGPSEEQHQDREPDLQVLVHALRVLEERLRTISA